MRFQSFSLLDFLSYISIHTVAQSCMFRLTNADTIGTRLRRGHQMVISIRLVSSMISRLSIHLSTILLLQPPLAPVEMHNLSPANTRLLRLFVFSSSRLLVNLVSFGPSPSSPVGR